MSPITKSKTYSSGDVGKVFEVLQLSTEEERESYRSLGLTGEKPGAALVYVTRLSNGTAPFRADD